MLSLFCHNRKVLSVICLLFFPLSAFAADLIESTATEISIPTLPTVTVEATRLDPLTGGTTLKQQQITNIPSRNNNTSDLLKLMPGVQMPEGADSSNTAGEIAPAAVSISGGRPYDNNFLIDGIGNNSLLDPQLTKPNTINDVPGHPQEIFLLNNLVQEISLLRSNISARHGGFTGGVIDIKTIDPAETFSGTLNYQATHSGWSQFHTDSSNKEDFDASNSEKYQPRFFKQNISATLHTPLNSHSGMIFNYSSLNSDIPLDHLGERTTQHRHNENYFIKYKNSPSNETTLTLSGLYAPYEGEYFLTDTKTSNYSIKGGGLTLNAKLNHSSSQGESALMFGLKSSTNSRRGPNNRYVWRNTGIKDWGPNKYSKEGGYGDIDKGQQSLATSLHHQFNGFRVGRSIHRVSSGLEAEYARTNYDRLSASTNHSVSMANTSVDCNGDNSDCIDGQQFTWFKTIYPQDTATAEMAQIALYAEDNITIKRLTLRPGLRGSWDDYLQNINLAPRLASSYDLFGNGTTTLIAGANRYYGHNLLTNRLAEQKANYSNWKRSTVLIDNKPQPWAEVPRSSFPTNRVAQLSTPYSDELTAGLKQKFLGGMLELDYIDRQGRDLIVTRSYAVDPVTKINYLEWTNAGRSHHQQVNLSWNGDWQTSHLLIATTWQKTTGNSDSYTDSETGIDELIWYKGKTGTRDELLLDDYNRPLRATAVYITEITPRLNFSNTTTYRSAYKSTEKTGETHLLPDATEIDIYEDVSNDQSLIFDWKFTLDVLQKKNLNLALTLDIYNVFDHQTHLGASDTDYELGRQIWLGANCNF